MEQMFSSSCSLTLRALAREVVQQCRNLSRMRTQPPKGPLERVALIELVPAQD